MCDNCKAHYADSPHAATPYIPTPGQDFGMDGMQPDKAERILVIEITNLREEIRALEVTGQQARSMQIRTAGHAEALDSKQEPVKREMGEPSPTEHSYIEQIRYLIYQLKGAREHLAASVDYMDTVI